MAKYGGLCFTIDLQNCNKMLFFLIIFFAIRPQIYHMETISRGLSVELDDVSLPSLDTENSYRVYFTYSSVPGNFIVFTCRSRSAAHIMFESSRYKPGFSCGAGHSTPYHFNQNNFGQFGASSSRYSYYVGMWNVIRVQLYHLRIFVLVA